MPDLTGFATLQDFASRQGFDKKYQRIIELQTKTNKILKIMPFKTVSYTHLTLPTKLEV